MTGSQLPLTTPLLQSAATWFRSKLFVIALLSAALFPLIPAILSSLAPYVSTAVGHSTVLNVVKLGEADFPVYPEIGHAVRFGVGKLEILSLSDSECEGSVCSPVLVLENGVPLKPHLSHVELRASQVGGFSHWGPDIYLSPSAGIDPKTAKYSLLYPSIPANNLYTSPHLKRMVWYLAFAAAFLAALFGTSLPWANCRALRLLLVGGLGCFIFVQARFMAVPYQYGMSTWNTFVVSADSKIWMEKYSAETLRPFVYPTFAHLVTRIGSNPIEKHPDFRHNSLGLPVNTPITDQLDHPLLLVVKAQKVFHILSIILAAWVLSAFIPAPIIVVGLGWLYNNLFFPHEYDTIMAETVAQAWMYLLIAASASTIFRYIHYKLFIVAALCAALFHTRSSGVFSFVCFGAISLSMLAQDFRKYWKGIGAATVTLGVLLALPSIHRFLLTGYLSPAPMYADAKTGYAVQFAQEEDVELFGDPIVKEWVKRVLVKRTEAHQAVRAAMPVVSDTQLLGTNLYTVARGVAGEMGLSEMERLKIFSEFSATILPKYRMKYFGLFLENFWNTAQISRLRAASTMSGWILLTVLTTLSIVVWSKEGLFCLCMIAMHFTHLVIMSLFDVPQQRYVFATEFLVVIGALFLVVGMARRIVLITAGAVGKFRASDENGASGVVQVSA
jgi:hypothetical protein